MDVLGNPLSERLMRIATGYGNVTVESLEQLFADAGQFEYDK